MMHNQTRTATLSHPAHPIMFWVLTSMALAIFAPCVLVPIWIEGKQLRTYEQSLISAVNALEEESAQAQAQAQALLADPLVNERMVRRELNHRPAGEQVIRWSPNELSAVRVHLPAQAAKAVILEKNNLSICASTVARWLPNWPWNELFAESPQRPILLMMAGGLLLAAFLLYGVTPISKVSLPASDNTIPMKR